MNQSPAAHAHQTWDWHVQMHELSQARPVSLDQCFDFHIHTHICSYQGRCAYGQLLQVILA